MALPIPDLCCNIAASIIYDPAKWLVGKLTDNPKFREIKAEYGWLESPNDFPDRFAEAFVSLFRDEKPKVLRSFFNEISVVQAIEDVKWGKISRAEFDQKIADIAQRMTIPAQLAGTGLNLETEIELLLAYFAEAANDSRTAAQAEDHQLLAGIDRKIDGLRSASPTAIWQQKFPNVAPYPKPQFFGDSRTDELADVHARLRGDQCLVLVNGMGGIGKTSVAAAFCTDFEAEFACIVWMHCAGSVREAFLRSPLFGRLFPAGSFQPGTSDEVIFEAMLAQMASAPGRKLLVLDNANDGDDLIAHRRRLEALPGWAVLITSRAEATGLPERKIGTLPLERARALFCKHYPPAATQTALLDHLLVAIGCHTLLLEIIAKQLAERRRKGKATELQHLCDRLERDGLLALPHPDAVKVDWQNHRPPRPKPCWMPFSTSPRCHPTHRPRSCGSPCCPPSRSPCPACTCFSGWRRAVRRRPPSMPAWTGWPAAAGPQRLARMPARHRWLPHAPARQRGRAPPTAARLRGLRRAGGAAHHLTGRGRNPLGYPPRPVRGRPHGGRPAERRSQWPRGPASFSFGGHGIHSGQLQRHRTPADRGGGDVRGSRGDL